MADAAGSGQLGVASGDGEKGAGGEEGPSPSASPSRPAAAGAARGAIHLESGCRVHLLESPDPARRLHMLLKQASRPHAPSGGAAISRQQAAGGEGAADRSRSEWIRRVWRPASPKSGPQPDFQDSVSLSAILTTRLAGCAQLSRPAA